MSSETEIQRAAHGRHEDLRLFWRLLRQARPYWAQLVGVTLASFLASPLALLTPLPLKIAVDSVLGHHPLPGYVRAILPGSTGPGDTLVVVVLATMVVVIAALTQIQAYGTWLWQASIGERLVMRFQAELFRHMQRLSLAYHDGRGTGDTMYRIQFDAQETQKVVVFGVIPILGSLFTLVSMVLVAARIDWQLAVVALLVCPALFALLRSYRVKVRGRWKDAKGLGSDATSVVQEVLGALRIVKAFGQEDSEHDRFVRTSTAGVRARVGLVASEARFGLLVGCASAVGTAVVLFLGVAHVRTGRITLGDLLLIMGYLSQLYELLQGMSKTLADLQGSMASLGRVFALLDEVVEVPERNDPVPLIRARGAIQFEGVSFAYSSTRPVLSGIDLELGAGSRLGIAGTTGAGKTTLVSLLIRFYDVTEGRILLDGVDLRDYRIEDLRRQFSLVEQDPILFSRTIRENIAYSRPGASTDEIVAAAKAANAHAFIGSLAQGYDTPVGERGMLLSGGERQRISIARAFLKDAPVLVLDEPTSAVDVGTEALIIEAMERLMEGRTTIVIAHRLVTLEHCTSRIRIEHGQIVEHEQSPAAHEQEPRAQRRRPRPPETAGRRAAGQRNSG